MVFWVLRYIMLATEMLWRLIQEGQIVVTSDDHGQQFGHSEPIHAVEKLRTRTMGRTVEEVKISALTGDLIIELSEKTYLQLFQLSSGYEAWRLTTSSGVDIFCRGGGIIALYSALLTS